MIDTVAHHTHVEDTNEGKAALALLPPGFIDEAARKPFPPPGLRRFFWEKWHSLVDNRSSRALETLRRNDMDTIYDHAILALQALTRAVSYRDYVILGLGQRPLSRLPPGYITFFRRHRVREFVNCEQCERFLHNKLLAKAYHDACCIPQARLYCYSVDRTFYGLGTRLRALTDLQAVTPAVGKPFIIKALNGRYGAQNLVVNQIITTPEECLSVIKHKANVLGAQSYLVEELLSDDLTPFRVTNSLNTLRLTTWMKSSGEVKVIGAAQRLAIADDSVDNWTSGGLAAAVDIDSGNVTGPYYSKYLSRKPDRILENPFRVPRWEKIVDLVKSAHRLYPGLRSVGWDVANTENGPFLIEGNHDWDTYIHQRTTAAGFDLM